MKFVLLEALIVMIAMRAVLSLIGHVPLWPTTPLLDFFAGLALVATAWICVEAAGRKLPYGRPVSPPHIPLERIGPYHEESVLVRFGARGHADINLN